MQEINLTAKLNTGGSVPPVIDELSVTRNGTYTPGSGVDGFSPVIVDVPQSGGVIESKTITENGTYTPGSGVDGFSPVVVNVPGPTIESKTITENGTYTPGSGVDGFSPVVVNVPVKEERALEYTITSNGDYSWTDGGENFVYNPIDITVNVPSSASIIVNKYPIVNNRTLQPVPCELTQGKYYSIFYYDDYLYSRNNNILGCTSFNRISTGTAVDRFFMSYNNTNKDWYCTDTSLYLNTKFDNDAVYCYVTIVEMGSSVIDPLIPTP